MAAEIQDDVLANQTYAHAFARMLVRPLLGTWVRPNHLTLLRMATGFAACAALAMGTRAGDWWSCGLWFITCVLDRADGELARIGDMRSSSGKVLDFYSDMFLDSFWFLAAGVSLRNDPLGDVAVGLGILTCIAMFVCIGLSELFERLQASGVKAFYGHRRFHPDDALFLLAVFPLLGLLKPVLIAASVCTPVIAAIVIAKYAGTKRRASDIHLQSQATPCSPRATAADGK